jgi:hypothetical protein
VAATPVPVELGWASLLASGCVCQARELSELSLLGTFIEASSGRHDQLLPQSPLPLEEGDGTESSKLLTMTWSFW